MDESRSAVTVNCHGWWEQAMYGRQSMTELEIKMCGDRFSGHGIDIIGPFTLDGTIQSSGTVVIAKQYLGQHQVMYFGLYDGEGTFAGHWEIGGDRGRWLISLRRSKDQSKVGIQDLFPAT